MSVRVLVVEDEAIVAIDIADQLTEAGFMVIGPAPSVAVYDCANKPQVRPGTFDLFCDGSGSFTKLHWSVWNASTATATGVLYVDNCEPNCAQGKWSHQDVDLIFWRSEPVKGHPGKRGYSQMTVLYPYHAIGNHSTFTQVPPGLFPGEF